MNRQLSRYRHQTRAAYLWLPLLATMLMACGTLTRRSLPQTVTPDGRTVYGTLPVGRAGREALTALPPVATYRWGLPSSHFVGTTAADDSASAELDLNELRMAATDVLRLNGWREARADETADFEVAVARIDRNAEWFETERDPREIHPDPLTCQNLPPTNRVNCVEPIPRNYPPIQVLKRGTDTRIAVAIVRVTDGAAAWWVAPQRVDIQREIQELLQAGARRASALTP